ncbi:hypothetical protein GLOIN_2v1487903 [Rhizophagus irregularis DAOM 181602=DAOM 197198]|nr:hypothetical protein GLOIN_2v1487903 [Rhizophagus irregularis DAOM 181602=DAOM 197198]
MNKIFNYHLKKRVLTNIPSWVILSKIVNFGFIKITPFKKEDSELQFWTRSKDPDKNKDTLIQLYNCVFLQGVIITCQLNLKNLIFLFII